VALVSQSGEIRLVLRGPGDNQDTETKGVTLAQVLGLEEKGDREAEKARPEPVRSEGVGNKLLDMLKAHASRPSTQAEPVAAVEPAQAWKMVLIRGSEITEVEVPSNGVASVPPTATPSTPQISPSPTTDDTKPEGEEGTTTEGAAARYGADE
jgi:hypothetical protein